MIVIFLFIASLFVGSALLGPAGFCLALFCGLALGSRLESGAK